MVEKYHSGDRKARSPSFAAACKPGFFPKDILDLSSEMGLALGVPFEENLGKIETATAKIYDFVDEVIERCLTESGDDILSLLAFASVGEDSLSRDEL